MVWNTHEWDTWHGAHAPAHSNNESKDESTVKAWEVAKAKLVKRRQAPVSPAARRFNAPKAPDTEVARRVEAVSKLEDLRQSWDTGVIKSAATREEARKNLKEHLDKVRKPGAHKAASSTRPKREEDDDIDDTVNPEDEEHAPTLDISNLSGNECDILLHHITLYKGAGCKTVDKETFSDRAFQGALEKLIKVKPTAPRARSASARPAMKVEGSSKRKVKLELQGY